MNNYDINQICTEIADVINKNKRGLIYRNYETFLSWFGMTNRRNLEVLRIVDDQLSKRGITFWRGKALVESVIDFQRGETITFRLNEIDNNQAMNQGNIEIEYKNAGSIQISNSESSINLYIHQEEAIQSLQNRIIKTNKTPFAGLLVLPTGGGKTLTAAYWLAKNVIDKNKKLLWIAHRHELLEQAKTTFHERLAYKDIFSNKTAINYRIISGIHDKPVNIKPTDDIIISSKDSLNTGFEYLYNNWIKGEKEVFLVIDEAHHATAKTYRKLIEKLSSQVDTFRMIGLTATPFRTAEIEHGLLAKVFPDDIIYKVDLRTLITRGILSEPIFEEVKTAFNMMKLLSEDEVDKLRYFDIDCIGKSTAKTIAENDSRNWSIVNRYVTNKEKYKQTIVFALNQDNAIALNKLFQEVGIKSDYVISSIKDQTTGVTLSSRDNKYKLDLFRAGQLEVLINVNILTEGTDLPKVQSIFLARPTISPILMTQMIGRGLRGEKAGGTKEAFIVSFIDDWQDKVAWVNPEKLIIEENTDFNDKDSETRKQIIRLVSINKIEEFAILTNQIIDTQTKYELEKLDFIERLPLGIYHFSILNQFRDEEREKNCEVLVYNDEEREKNCEVLVYNNIKQSYSDFINGLPFLFKKFNLEDNDSLSRHELELLCNEIENEYFFGCEKYPGYRKEDIEDILHYYVQTETFPRYIELKDREKYDLSKIANEILENNLGRKDEEDFKNEHWESNKIEWKAFFGYDKRYFLNEIDLAIRKLANPDLYQHSNVIPQDIKERRKLEEMTMNEIREYNPAYWKWLSDKVYEKHTDNEGYYVSAKNQYRSKNKLDFQIDHIISRHNGGLTKIENLQLLTRSENAKKGSM